MANNSEVKNDFQAEVKYGAFSGKHDLKMKLKSGLWHSLRPQKVLR